MTQRRRDEQAETVIRAAIFDLFEDAKIEKINVRPGENDSGEPMLFVTIFLQSGQKRMSGARLLDAITAAATALREIDDDRFPYVTFLSLENEHAEDTRPAA